MKFDKLVKQTLQTVKQNSAVMYAQTYRLWVDWCSQSHINIEDFNPENVYDFLAQTPVTKQTRSRHLAALRKLARVSALDPKDDVAQGVYRSLQLLKVPESDSGKERYKKALNSEEINHLLEIWNSKKNAASIRNYAIIATLLFTGLRRNELMNLQWRDIDTMDGIIRVRHGKNDQYREVAIIRDEHDTGCKALDRWHNHQVRLMRENAYYFETHEPNQQCRYVFTPLSKKGWIIEDEPISSRMLNKIGEATEELSGIEFKLHDMRRTHGTILLREDVPLADVQAQLGHKQASTTIQNYAVAADALQRRDKILMHLKK